MSVNPKTEQEYLKEIYQDIAILNETLELKIIGNKEKNTIKLEKANNINDLFEAFDFTNDEKLDLALIKEELKISLGNVQIQKQLVEKIIT